MIQGAGTAGGGLGRFLVIYFIVPHQKSLTNRVHKPFEFETVRMFQLGCGLVSKCPASLICFLIQKDNIQAGIGSLSRRIFHSLGMRVLMSLVLTSLILSKTSLRYSVGLIPCNTQLEINDCIIATVSAPNSLQQNNQFFLPSTIGLITLSVWLLSIGISGSPRNNLSPSSSLKAQLQALVKRLLGRKAPSASC